MLLLPWFGEEKIHNQKDNLWVADVCGLVTIAVVRPLAAPLSSTSLALRARSFIGQMRRLWPCRLELILPASESPAATSRISRMGHTTIRHLPPAMTVVPIQLQIYRRYYIDLPQRYHITGRLRSLVHARLGLHNGVSSDRRTQIGRQMSGEGSSKQIWGRTVKARKLAYYGHTMRKQRSCLEKEIMQGTVPGAHRRGRPRTAWVDNIRTWTGLSMEESVRMTEDRDKWRKYVHGVANPRIEDG